METIWPTHGWPRSESWKNPQHNFSDAPNATTPSERTAKCSLIGGEIIEQRKEKTRKSREGEETHRALEKKETGKKREEEQASSQKEKEEVRGLSVVSEEWMRRRKS